MQETILTEAEKGMLKRQAVRYFFFPRRCPFCERTIGFLPECNAPSCLQAQQEQKLREKTLNAAEHYWGELTGAAAVYHYKGAPRDAVLQMKFHKMRAAGYTLGNIMAKELFGCTFLKKYGIVIPEKIETIAAYQVIIPVPPSDDTRGYNVPTLLAQPISRALGVPLQADALVRVRFTQRQARLPFAERFANVAGAFVARDGLDLTGKQVLLVDDVITTGATVSACAQALYKAGAESVFAVSFAVADAPEE